MGLRILTLCLLLLSWCTAVEAGDRPNVILIVTDDQRADTIEALGNPVIQTPHLNWLVRQGTVFTHAHAAQPLCYPSRAEILTGMNGLRNGVMPPDSNTFRDDVVMLPQLLADAGYHTWYVGKWHTTGRPSTRGYAETLGLFTAGGGKYWKDQVDFKGTPVTGYKGWVFQTDDGKLFPERGVGLTADISEQFADAAIEFIERETSQPYFLHINFTAPHDPLIVPTGYEGKYDPDLIPLPANYAPEHPFDHGNLRGRDEQMLPWPRTKQAVRENLAVYYEVISHMDEQIGRILNALRTEEQLQNTVVIFTSDHGLAVGSHGLMGKQNMYDHTVLVPLIFSGPGIPAGQQRDALCYLRDLFPTICEWAEVKPPANLDSQSLIGVIKGEQAQVREQVYCYFSDKQRMIRDQEWKYIHYPEIDREQLFHLASDPDELNDLSGKPETAARQSRMKSELAKWLQEQTSDNKP